MVGAFGLVMLVILRVSSSFYEGLLTGLISSATVGLAALVAGALLVVVANSCWS